MLIRSSVSIVLAAGVTLGLFTIMQTLVEMGDIALDEYGKRKVIDMVRLQRESTTNVKKRVLPTRPRPAPIPKTPRMTLAKGGAPGAATLTVAAPPMETSFDLRGKIELGAAPADGDAVPLVRVQPIYPRHARARQIEGWVLFEFDVTAAGDVTNIRVLDAKPKGVFESAATQAIRKWKYRPRIENGKPQPQLNQRAKVDFNLTD